MAARAVNATRLLAYVTAASERLGELAPVTQRYVAERTETSRRRLPPNAWQAAWTRAGDGPQKTRSPQPAGVGKSLLRSIRPICQNEMARV